MRNRCQHMNFKIVNNVARLTETEGGRIVEAKTCEKAKRHQADHAGCLSRGHTYTASDVRWAINQALNGKTDAGMRQAIIEDVGEELSKLSLSGSQEKEGDRENP